MQEAGDEKRKLFFKQIAWYGMVRQTKAFGPFQTRISMKKCEHDLNHATGDATFQEKKEILT
jgi:hypothetical protein